MTQALYDDLSVRIIAAGCRNRCRHCSVAANTSGTALLALEQVAILFDDLRNENAKSPPLWGRIGPSLLYEPMDHPDIVDIQSLSYELAPDTPLVRTFATNGHRIATDPRYAEIVSGLHKSGVEQFQLTLHGLARNHDWFAGRPGAYGDLLEAARRLSRCVAKIEWVYFLNRRNVHEMEEAMQTARVASRGTQIEEYISVWGPAGRAVGQEKWAVRAADLLALSDGTRRMRWLPEYRPEREWVQQAQSGEMQGPLEAFYDSARAKGGIPDCVVQVDRDNVGVFADLLAERRQQAQSQKMPRAGEHEDLASLASGYGNSEGDLLYRVSTMKSEWVRRRQEARVMGRSELPQPMVRALRTP